MKSKQNCTINFIDPQLTKHFQTGNAVISDHFIDMC